MADKGQRRLVLSEEDYTSKLSLIVARDYFPEISRLERENSLLDCRLAGDAIGAVAVRRATRNSLEEEEAAAARREGDDRDVLESESNENTLARRNPPGANIQIRKRMRPLEEETVTGFVMRATNEDDDEFDSNLKQNIRENRQRLEAIYQTKSNPTSKTNENERPGGAISNLCLEMASDDFAPESNRTAWKHKPLMRNGLFFNPTPMRNSSETDSDAIGNVREQALLKNSTALMVLSDGSDDMPPPSKQHTSGLLSNRNAGKDKLTQNLLKSQLVEYIPKHKLEKKIEPSATRFPSNPSLIPIPGSALHGSLDEETDSDSHTDYMSSTDASTDLDAPLRSLSEERRRFKRKKESYRQSYPYVAMSSPRAKQQLPISTHGAIDGPPLVLSHQEEQLEKPESTSSFRMPSKNEREFAASNAEKLMARRARLASPSSLRRSSLKSGKHSSMCQALGPGSLTPAALSLMKAKSIKLRNRDAFGSALRRSYTPQVVHRSSSSKSSRRRRSANRPGDHAYNATPQR
ncbi:unnamed protein product [Pseudo-nitzschia multistriata]|uniref:Uncharacterized protein n=1 Tax=Pseudo-nitzschia multistriata TaxID=183589 RepID=A0A448ZRP3_9STRA|nr:unnamed protein product [Pseudo-nitzschia multistriata]